MDTLEIYLSRLTSIRDGIKYVVGMETMPIKLEAQLLHSLLEIGREIERTKRAMRALSEAAPLPQEGSGSADPELPFVNETVDQRIKSSKPTKS